MGRPPPQIHLVDATYELFRAWFALPSSKAPDGREVAATRGVLQTLLYLCREEGATHVACATDHVVRSFRNDLYAGYKTEEGVPEDLLAQFPLVEEAMRALGVVVWPMVEFEADDALAAGAARFAGHAAAVLSRNRRIEDVPAAAAAWEPKVRGAERLAATLVERRAEALLYKRLATLREDVPLAESLDDLEWQGARPELRDFCARIGYDGLAARVHRWR